MQKTSGLSRRSFIAAAGGTAALVAGGLAAAEQAQAAGSGALGTYAGEYNQYDHYDEETTEGTEESTTSLLEEQEAATGSYTPGTYVGEAQGIGGTVTATVTVDETSITDVVLEGPDETPSIGGAALEQLAPSFVERQSSLVDAVGGATVTSKAAREAVANALKQASGIADKEWTLDEINMGTGYYYSFVQGFSLISKVPVMVRTHSKTIESIDISTENGETDPVRLTVEENMIPAMLANQSYEVDTVCGATVTSSALKQGVRECLIQALVDGGTPAEAISYFAKRVVPEPDEPQTIDVDVLVVGMGGTGTAAFMAACEAEQEAGRPVSVLAIEKTGRTGGTSAMTSSVLAVNPAQFQADHNGGEDYVDLDYIYEARANSPYSAGAHTNGYDYPLFGEDPELDPFWDIYVEKSGDMLDWLISHGFYFGNEPTGDFYAPGLMANYEYAGTMGDQCKMEVKSYFDQMIADAVALGGQYKIFTELTDLIYDEPTGRVAGAHAQDTKNGTEYTINAKVVVGCTGGMGGNKELWGKHSNMGEGFELMGLRTNDGKLLEAAWDLGAGEKNVMTGSTVHTIAPNIILNDYPVNRIEGELDPWIGRVATWSMNDVPLFMVTNRDCLFVNRAGERYGTEAPVWPMTFVGWMAGNRFYSITSKQRLQEIADNGFTHTNTNVFKHHGFNTFPVNTPLPDLFDVVNSCVKLGNCVQADTLEELAEALGMADTSVLPATVARYNGFCETGVDEDYGKDASLLIGLGDEGPWYAFIGQAEDYTSEGGLSIDTQFRVTRADGTPIDGLYCGGTDCLGYMPCDYAGNAQGWAFLSGRLAATNAVAELA
jgi:fumarate reductase flavoprotein subunit